MTMDSVILVQIADREWTLEAVHCACLLAWNTSAQIALVKMIPVQHPGWLGTEAGYMNFTHEEQDDFADYQATLEDYGVAFTPVTLQYVTFTEAIAQAAEQVNAQLVFAKIPESRIPLWTKFQLWMLKREFDRHGRQWIQHPVYDTSASSALAQDIAEIDQP